jgi:hypothetical protein
MEGQLVIGGHFWEVADQLGDKCGHRTGGPQALDPNNECKTRKGIAAYSFSGRLDPVWSPTYAGKYSLVWALHVEGEATHRRGVPHCKRGYPELLRAPLASFHQGR